jgi:hypothetical protein
MSPAPPAPSPVSRPATLEPGQVLARTLLEPARGHALLAAGSLLTPAIIEKILRLGLAEETLRCLDPNAPAEPAKAPPAVRPPASRPPASRQPAKAPDLGSVDELDQLFAPPSAQGEAFREAWSLVKGLIPRVHDLEPVQHRDFRIRGCGSEVHPLNVMLLALQLGADMRLSPDDLLSLAQASLLHDVGFRRLGKERFKSTAISSYERRLLERHVEYGMELLDSHREQFSGLKAAAREAIYAHHERWDGSGYPRGLKGERIPLLGRIIAIVDSYDAMLTDQVYRSRRLPEEAYREILAQSGQAYDPAIARIFKRVIAPYPVNSLIRLETGDVARVVAPGEDPCRPVVHMPGVARPVELSQPGAPRITQALYPRRFQRFSRISPVHLRVPNEHGTYPGCTLNVSLGGACVALDASLEPGTLLTMELTMPGAPRLELPGLVVWRAMAHRKTCLGLSFQPMPADAHAWVRSFCRA